MAPGDEAELGLRERKKRQARAAMSLAVIRLSVERGWANVTIEDVAEAANVSVRTFRNYFSGKAEAVASRHLDRMAAIADELRARPAGEPLWDAIANAAVAQYALGQHEDPTQPRDGAWGDGIRLMLTEPDVQGEIVKATVAAQQSLAEAVAERTGTAPAETYPQLVAAVAGAAMMTAIEQSMRSGTPGQIIPLMRDAFAQVAAGLPIP